MAEQPVDCPATRITVSNIFLLLNLNYLILLYHSRQHLALYVYLCHLGLGIAVNSDTGPELAWCAFLAIEYHNYGILGTRLDCVGGKLLAGTAATGEYLMYIQIGIAGVCKDKGAFAYWSFPAKAAQIYCCLFKLNVSTSGIIGHCRQREQCT